MSKSGKVISVIIVLLIAGLIVINFFNEQRHKGKPQSIMKGPKTMELTSPEFPNGGNIPKKYSCDGENVNPPLTISNVPENAQSLALILEDPDAPGGTWTHWVMWNISPKVSEILEHAIPTDAMQGSNSSGKTQYDGPCPPDGNHRYYFKLYALDNKPDLVQGASKDELLKAMKGNIITQAELMGKYGPR